MRGDSSDECGGVGYDEVRGLFVCLWGVCGRRDCRNSSLLIRGRD